MAPFVHDQRELVLVLREREEATPVARRAAGHEAFEQRPGAGLQLVREDPPDPEELRDEGHVQLLGRQDVQLPAARGHSPAWANGEATTGTSNYWYLQLLVPSIWADGEPLGGYYWYLQLLVLYWYLVWANGEFALLILSHCVCVCGVVFFCYRLAA